MGDGGVVHGEIWAGDEAVDAGGWWCHGVKRC